MNFNTAEKMKHTFICCLVIICCLTCFIQHQLFLSWDIGSLLNSTNKLLAGGNYVDDFFIPNTPMILYLYVPPLLLAKFSQINVLFIFPLYIFFLAALSYTVCYQLINKIFLPQDFVQRYLFAITLALVFLIVPIYEFGQRDHLLVLMTMPYLLATVCRLEAKPLTKILAFAIGVFAGLGIAIKPHFLILPLLIESYYAFSQRNWLAWCKPEIVGIIAVLALYVSFVLITRQDYVAVIMPYLVKYYYGSSWITWFGFLFNDALLYIYITVIFYVFLNKFNKYKKLSAILFTALIAFICTFMTQGFTYFYHMVPALSLAILMIEQLFVNIFTQAGLTSKDYKIIAIPAMCLLLMQVYMVNLSFSMMFIDPAQFFVVFTIAFINLILVFKFTENSLITIVSTLIVGTLIYLLSAVALGKAAYFLQILLTLFIFAIFCKVAFANTASRLLQMVFTALLGVCLLELPCWIVLHVYEVGVQYKRYTLNKLIEFMRTQPPHTSIYMLATGIHYTFPMASYTDAVIAQRFDALWMVRSFVKDIARQKGQQVRDEIRDNTSDTFVLNMIVNDLRRHKPELVFVETKYVGQRTLNFNFLEYFSESKAFQEVWKNYHYYTTVEQAGVFKLEVYKLNQNQSLDAAVIPAQAGIHS
jgi:hypothetical protein